MKPKTLIILAVAVTCGLFAMVGVQQALNKAPSAADAVETVDVLYAVADIPPGIELTEDYVAFKEMPIDVAPEGAVTEKIQYEKRALRIAVVAGETIMQAKLGEPGERGISMAIPEGMRVIAVSVDETKTFSNMLQASDRVDIIVTFKVRAANGQTATVTNTLLEYVEVFATDNQTASKVNGNKSDAKTRTVSLLVTPEQMNYVKLAEEAGTLSLAWRHRTDDEENKSSVINESLLMQLSGISGGQRQGNRPGYDDERPTGSGDKPQEQMYADENEEEDGSDLRSFLNNGPTEDVEDEMDATTTEQVVETEPAVPTWKITVQSGGESVDYEVDDPSQSTENTEPTETTEMIQGALNSIIQSIW